MGDVGNAGETADIINGTPWKSGIVLCEPACLSGCWNSHI